MPDINYGLLDTAPRAPQVQQYQVQPNQNTQALLGGVQAGQQIVGSAADTALRQQQLKQAQQMDPLLVQEQQQKVASGAIGLTQQQRQESDIKNQRAAAAQGWDKYVETLNQTDPEKALAAIDTKTKVENNIIGKNKNIDDASFSKANNAASLMTKSGNIMHDIMSASVNPQTGQPDDAKVMTAYAAQYPQIAAIDPKNAPDPKTATPAQIEAYGASSMHLGLDYSLALKTKYAEQLEAAKQAETTKGAITTDAVKDAQGIAVKALPVKTATEQYLNILNEVQPNQVGAGFNLSLKGKKMIAALGGDPNISVPEALKLASDKLLVAQLKTNKTMPRSEAVVKTIGDAIASPTLQLNVQKNALNSTLQEANEQIVQPDFMQDYKNKNTNDLAGVNVAWQKFLEADPTYQKTGQHDPNWVSNPDNYKPFLDKNYKPPKTPKETPVETATKALSSPRLEDIEAEIKRRGLK